MKWQHLAIATGLAYMVSTMKTPEELIREAAARPSYPEDSDEAKIIPGDPLFAAAFMAIIAGVIGLVR